MRYPATTGSPVRPPDWLGNTVQSQSVSAPDPVLVEPIAVLGLPAVFWAVLAAGLAVVVAVLVRLLDRVRWSSSTDSDATERADPVSTLDEDERFVADLLARNDGRVRQSAIVESSDWSKSKVSRLLSRMERDGHVEKITVGRENVIVLADQHRDG